MRHLPARPLILCLGIATVLCGASVPTLERHFRGGRSAERPIVCDGLRMDDPLFGTTANPQTRKPTPSPWSALRLGGPAVITAAMVYDSDRHRALLIAGGGVRLTNAVWSLPLDQDGEWSLLTSRLPLSPRRSPAAIYDPRRQRVLVYGGYDGSFLGDVLALSLAVEPTWSRRQTQGEAPPPLAASAAVLDSKRDRMILIQGNDGAAPAFRNPGVWTLDLATDRWCALSAAGPAPAARSAHSAIYDPIGDRVILFGGSFARITEENRFSDELWELRLSGKAAWRRLDLVGPKPGAREEHCAVYDPGRREMLIYGGVGAGTDYAKGQIVALHDAWALSLDGAFGWRRLPDHPMRSGRWGHRAVFDPQHSRMIVSGGWGGMGTTLAFVNGPAVRAPVAAKAPPTPASPADLPLRLAVRMPNPARGALAMELALPAKGARLELFDVSGRRVAQRELSDKGPGFVRYRWDATERLPAGIYLMRLSTARETVRKKIILLH